MGRLVLVLFYSLAYAFGPPLLALLLGGVGRRRVLAWSEFGLAGCALLMLLVPSFEGLLMVRTVLAVVAGTYTGTAMATAAMLAPLGQRGRYMQVASMGQAIASLAGVPLGALVATQFGWRFVYAALAIMAALAMQIVWDSDGAIRAASLSNIPLFVGRAIRTLAVFPIRQQRETS